MQTHPRARARRPVSTESSPASTMPRMTTKDPHAYSLPDPEDTRDTKSPERHPANMGDAGHRQSPSDRSGLDVIEGIRCDAGDAGDAGVTPLPATRYGRSSGTSIDSLRRSFVGHPPVGAPQPLDRTSFRTHPSRAHPSLLRIPMVGPGRVRGRHVDRLH